MLICGQPKERHQGTHWPLSGLTGSTQGMFGTVTASFLGFPSDNTR